MKSQIFQHSGVSRDAGNYSGDNQERPQRETEAAVWKREVLEMSAQELENKEKDIVWNVLRPAGELIPGTDEHRAKIDRLYEVRAALAERKVEVQMQSNFLSNSPVSTPVTPYVRLSLSTPGITWGSLKDPSSQDVEPVSSVLPPAPGC